MTGVGVVAVAALVVGMLAYEFHDELTDDDREDSLVDSVWLLGALLAIAVVVFVVVV